jgi:aminopeptidase
MPFDFASRLHAFAEVIVRVGLNLQRGQRLLLAEPYELQGVARSAEVLVEAVRHAATAAGSPGASGIDVVWGDGPRLREFAAQRDWRGFTRLVAANAGIMTAALRNGDALLFLQGSQPELMRGLPAGPVAELRRIGWEHFGPLAQALAAGATNWTAAPAPSPAWAHAVFPDLPVQQRLEALWDTVFAACRVGSSPEAGPVAVAAWRDHLQALSDYRDRLNRAPAAGLRYEGEGTDLTVALPTGHRWCTAQLTTRSGLPFVANLPTEEVFTLPHRDSASGTVRVSRPVSYGGATIEGIELVFRHGAVIRATATSQAELLRQLLASDEGAARLGEVALVPGGTPPALAGRCFHHPLLDENAANHIALGEAYGFCLRAPDPVAANRSLIHVDLPLDARATLSGAEPA